MTDAADELRTRARARLLAEAPTFSSRRTDLKGDHALDPEHFAALPDARPKIAAVLVPIVLHSDEPAILLTERATGLRQHSGQVAFPGGRMDPTDATPVDAALREAAEEIGLDREAVEPAGFLDPYLSGTNYFVLPVVGFVRSGAVLRLNPDEVSSAFEVPLAFLMDEDNQELHAREWQGGVRQYYAMPWGDHYIWGVTAGILRNLYERLYGP